MNQHSSNRVIIYVKMLNMIYLFLSKDAGPCTETVTEQMFDIYLFSLLFHIYCECIRFVSTPRSKIEQIGCASVWRVIIFGRLQITMALRM